MEGYDSNDESFLQDDDMFEEEDGEESVLEEGQNEWEGGEGFGEEEEGEDDVDAEMQSMLEEVGMWREF